MTYPKGERLVNIFLERIQSLENFEIIAKSNPLCLAYKGHRFAIFFKCISYAGNPYPLNTTRAQLPQRKEFSELAAGDIFLFLGYDVANDLYVCWDPQKTRSRLNKKGYVSFFSRQSEQDAVVDGKISVAHLTNGDTYVLFKRKDLNLFFQEYETLFPYVASSSIVDLSATATGIASSIRDVEEDISIKLLVDSLLKKHSTDKLFIISECMNKFGEFYSSMRFIDWAKLIQSYIDRISFFEE